MPLVLCVRVYKTDYGVRVLFQTKQTNNKDMFENFNFAHISLHLPDPTHLNSPLQLVVQFLF
jgi:hypothetical protein